MKTVVFLALASLFSVSLGAPSKSPYDWFGHDAFDTIMDLYNAIDGNNCKQKEASELVLPEVTVSMVPQSNQLLDVSSRVYRNRTCLLGLHDLALSRGYFFSYVFKALNESNEFWMQPGLQYYYWRLSSFVTAFPGCVNGTSTEFDYNVTYPNWLSRVPFNTTIELFGPRATRNYGFMANRFQVKGPSMNRIHIVDIGIGPQRNYTDKESSSSHVRYAKWLPDFSTKTDSRKGSYTVAVKYSESPGKWVGDSYDAKTFFGPPLTRLQDNVNLPVIFTRPYFDCGGRDVWMFSAVSPIVDVYPRYRKWEDIIEYGETPSRFVGAASMDVDWDMIDINPCPLGPGNPGPNIFAGIARCKPTTMCQPLHGWGFARGSYECVCKPGNRLPHWQDGPFQGALIELATEEEYQRGFDCLPIASMRVVPSINSGDMNRYNASSIFGRRRRDADNQSEKTEAMTHKDGADNARSTVKTETAHQQELSPKIVERMVEVSERKVTKSALRPRTRTSFAGTKPSDEVLRRVYGTKKNHKLKSVEHQQRAISKHRTRRDFVDAVNIDRMDLLFRHIRDVDTNPNCSALPIEQLILPGGVGFGAREQFQNQGRTALALAHFLSSYLQLVDHFESHGIIKGDRLLNPELLHAEVLSHVMADHKIRGLGIWFDEDQYMEPHGSNGELFRRRRFFAPYSFQNDGQYRSVDMAGDPRIGYYLQTPWFKKAKARWISNLNGLVTYAPAGKVRVDTDGHQPGVKFRPYPSKFKAAPYELGMWTPPYYSCTGYVNDWVITYVAPFFGLDEFDNTAPYFMGVVTVDIKLEFLDINQCPGSFSQANAFKDTARCDYQSTYCVPVENKRFQRGSYKCECKQGYEYPFLENAWFFDGSLIESEYDKKSRGEFNKFDLLRCRPGSAAILSSSWLTLCGFIFTFINL